MSNPTFKPSEGKREEFRKYLEKNGVMDALTKVLVNLYEEVDKPEDALEYIRDRLALLAGVETYKIMKGKQEELEVKVSELEQEIEQMKMAAEMPPEGEEVPPENIELQEGEQPPMPPTDEPQQDAAPQETAENPEAPPPPPAE